jgi:hypothetical protein
LPMKNGVDRKALNLIIDFILTFSDCLRIFANHETTKASSA